jgi:hypothetical protein
VRLTIPSFQGLCLTTLYPLKHSYPLPLPQQKRDYEGNKLHCCSCMCHFFLFLLRVAGHVQMQRPSLETLP